MTSIGLVIAMLLGPEAPATHAVSSPKPKAAPKKLVAGDKLGRFTRLSDPSGKALDRFYDALREVATGKRKRTRVAFYGASHMAADAFTRVIRHRLQGHFGDGGPGFVVPAKPWRNYNHRDVDIRYSKTGWKSYWVSTRHNHDNGRYGLAGCSFESDDENAFCKVSTRKSAAFGRSVSRVELYFYKQPGGGDIKVTVDGGEPTIVPTKAAQAGPGFAAITMPEGDHTIELRPAGNGNVMLFGIALERDQPGVVVDTMGINGARAAAVLQWDPAVFGPQLRKRDPDLVVLAYGTNATGDKGDPIPAYMARLDRVFTQVKASAPNASCIYVGPSDRPIKVVKDRRSGKWKAPKRGRKARRKGPHGFDPDLRFLPRPRQKQVIKAQRRIAHKHGCAYWDWVKMMGGDLSMVKWVHSEPRMGAKDYVHLTGRGYVRAANLFWKALMRDYGPLPTPKSTIPAMPRQPASGSISAPPK